MVIYVLYYYIYRRMANQIILNYVNEINYKWLIFVTIIFIFIYNFIIKYWWYFQNNGVKFIRGIPIIGSQYKMMFGSESITESYQNLYQQFKSEKFIGIYEFPGTPTYLIRDPDLIKKITIKDFDHFVDHRFHIDVKCDSILGRSLFFMKDQKWRDMRATLSPAFTGSKMKMMFNLILKCSEQLTKQLVDDAKKVTPIPSLVLEMKDLFLRFGSDIIATCAFGIETNSLKNRNNEFYRTGQAIINLDGINGIKFFGYVTMPNIMKLFKIKFIEEKYANYFRKLILENIEYREKNNFVRPDVINLLLEARKGLLKSDDDENIIKDGNSTISKKWEDDDIVAQSVIFVVAGFDTVSTVLSFAAHSLTVNPDVQQKLYEEILNVKNNIPIDEDLSYDQLNNIKYLDAVINETMRRWPPTIVSDRIVTKPYTLETGDGRNVKLKIGDGIQIPIPGLHMDPKYFPKPEEFDPERFMDENFKNIKSGTFLPFGMGPRNCIGSRFAIMECKVILYYLILKFRFEMCEKTQHPIQLRRKTANIDAANGFWVKLVPRE